ncbi:hypothetical protein PG993_003992 [Apiospora rasikravindrae]|uniref:Uncharacterized protein n=1 Tax=Apiospora rasikravindrae TaxID=990691 RepID=A0ABR1U153_9PEZI
MRPPGARSTRPRGDTPAGVRKPNLNSGGCGWRGPDWPGSQGRTGLPPKTRQKNGQVRTGVTLELPWSYPGATLELPWSYPVAETKSAAARSTRPRRRRGRVRWIARGEAPRSPCDGAGLLGLVGELSGRVSWAGTG